MEGRSAMSLASFYDHYLTCTMGFGQTYADSFIDIFSIADMIHKLCNTILLGGSNMDAPHLALDEKSGTV
eukprot:evm.model.NODE_7173_length_8571_cov_21.853226.4